MTARLLGGRDLVSELRLAAKMTLAGTLAWWAASALGAHRPIFAVLVPLVAMSGDPFSALSVSVARILGVFVGVAVGIGVVHASVPGTVAVGIALGAGTVAGILLRVGGRPNIQAAVSALFMLGVTAASHAGVARIWETAVGAAVAVPVSALLWPPDPVRELRHRLEQVRQLLAADLAAVADALATGDDRLDARLEELRAHSREAARDVFDVEARRQALRLSPLRRGDEPKLRELERRIDTAARLYRHARSVARDERDLRVQDATLAAATRDLAAASDLLLAGADAAGELDRAADALAGARAGDAAVVAAQLRQLHADASAAASGVPFRRYDAP